MKTARYAAMGVLALVGLGACASESDDPLTVAQEEASERTTSTERREPTTQAPTTSEEPTTTTTAPPTTTTTVDPEFSNAVRAAEQYLDFGGFSRQGLVDQLSSEYGDQYPVEVATAAVDSLNVDYNAEAVEAAESYLEFQPFSHAGLVDQLSSEYGDQFTREQAEHGASVALG